MLRTLRVTAPRTDPAEPGKGHSRAARFLMGRPALHRRTIQTQRQSTVCRSDGRRQIFPAYWNICPCRRFSLPRFAHLFNFRIRLTPVAAGGCVSQHLRRRLRGTVIADFNLLLLANKALVRPGKEICFGILRKGGKTKLWLK